MPGIYLHIPYCSKACHYCDFHFSTQLSTMPAMVDAMSAEINLRRDYLKGEALNSIYLGGGTPSLLGSEALRKLFSTMQQQFDVQPSAEITLEVNPDDVSKTSLQAWSELGINRLSIGLQSFNDEELKWMNRTHSAAQSEQAVKLAQDRGFENISIDLIYGSKFQTLNSWELTLKKAIALQTQHISSYNLTIEKKTVLGNRYSKGLEPAVNDLQSRDQFLLMRKMLQSAHYVHYEISNFGLPGKIAVHNSNYWLGQTYLGIGPSAHSYDGKSRQWNVSNNGRYIKAILKGEVYYETEFLTDENKYNEYVLTRLRTIWGCDQNEIAQSFGPHFASHFEKGIRSKMAFIQQENGIARLNEEGMLQADGLAASLFI